MAAIQKRYCDIPYRRGGTFTFRRPQSEVERDDPETIEFVAVTELTSPIQDSPLGVYFMIDDNTFFAASIDARINHDRSIAFDQRTSAAQREQLTKCVRKALDEECASAGWNLDKHNDNFGKNLLCICAQPVDRDYGALHRSFTDVQNPPVDDTRLSPLVAAAIKRWVFNKLQAQSPHLTTVDEQRPLAKRAKGVTGEGRGFIVKHGGDGTDLIAHAAEFGPNVTETGGKDWRWIWEQKDANPRWKGRVELDE